MQPTTPLRSFFAAFVCSDTGPTTIPSELKKAARQVLRGRDDAEVDDVVGDFLLRLVEATRRGTSASAKLLVDLDEAQLRAVVRHRMQQIIAERSPHRHLVKQLRDAVRRVNLCGLPPVPDSAPPSLMKNDKLHTAHVAAAVAWILHREDAPPRDDHVGVAERLREAYFTTTAMPLNPPTEAVDADPVDVQKVLTKLRSELDAHMLEATQARLRDLSLGEISATAGIAVSSAHARVARAAIAVRAIIDDADADRATGEAALALLAA